MNKSVPPFRRIGYARVSTVGQTLESQLEQLKAAGCELIFKEKVTGTRADRKELMRLLKTIGPGDQLVVTRIDRLARSVFDLFPSLSACSMPEAISYLFHSPWPTAQAALAGCSSQSWAVSQTSNAR